MAYQARVAGGRVPWQALLATGLAALALIFTTHSFQFLFAEQVIQGLTMHPSAAGNPVYIALFAGQVVIAGVLLAGTLAARPVRASFLVATAFAAFVALSAMWSVSATTTMFYWTGLVFEIATAYVIAEWITPRRFLRVVFATFSFIIAASFVLLAIDPTLAGDLRYGGGWLSDRELSGVMSSKNLASFVFASVFVLALNGRAIGLGPATRIVAGIASLIAVILSNSATAVMIVILAVLIGALMPVFGRLRRIGLYVALLVAIASIYAIPFLDVGDRLGAFGRDTTFTGRTDLWAIGIERMADRPIAGFGYYGFFDTDPFSPVWAFWGEFLYFLTATFHNSAIEIGVALGIAGLAWLFAILARAGMVIINDAIEPDVALAAGLLLAVFVVGSTMESAIMHHNYVATLIAFWAFFAADRGASR